MQFKNVPGVRSSKSSHFFFNVLQQLNVVTLQVTNPSFTKANTVQDHVRNPPLAVLVVPTVRTGISLILLQPLFTTQRVNKQWPKYPKYPKTHRPLFTNALKYGIYSFQLLFRATVPLLTYLMKILIYSFEKALKKTFSFTNLKKKKYALQAADADPSQCSSTSSQNPPIQQLLNQYSDFDVFQDIESCKKCQYSLFYDCKHHC